VPVFVFFVVSFCFTTKGKKPFHKAQKEDTSPLFWRCQNIPLLAKGEGRRTATG